MKDLNKQIEEILSFKDCGNFEVGRDDAIRECYKCERKIQLCVNCYRDHHLLTKEEAIKALILKTCEEVIDDVENIIKDTEEGTVMSNPAIAGIKIMEYLEKKRQTLKEITE